MLTVAPLFNSKICFSLTRERKYNHITKTKSFQPLSTVGIPEGQYNISINAPFVKMAKENFLICIILKFHVGDTESLNAPRGKAGMDEATMVGLRELAHSGLPPIWNPAYE